MFLKHGISRNGHTFGRGKISFGRICRLQKAAEVGLIEKVRFCNVALTPSHGVDTLVKTAQDRQWKALRLLLLLSVSPVCEVPTFALRRCAAMKTTRNFLPVIDGRFRKGHRSCY